MENKNLRYAPEISDNAEWTIMPILMYTDSFGKGNRHCSVRKEIHDHYISASSIFIPSFEILSLFPTKCTKKCWQYLEIYQEDKIGHLFN